MRYNLRNRKKNILPSNDDTFINDQINILEYIDNSELSHTDTDTDFITSEEDNSENNSEENNSEENNSEEDNSEEDNSEDNSDIDMYDYNDKIYGNSAPSTLCYSKKKYSNNKIFEKTILKKYSKEEKKYISKLEKEQLKDIIGKEIIINNTVLTDIIPLRFKIIQSNINIATKRMIINKIEQYSQMKEESGEYYKLKNWLHNINQLPFDNYIYLPVNINDTFEKINLFMQNTRNILDTVVYGHEEPKQQILRIIAQLISNPSANGHCIGIHGPMGIGKTSLIKDGLSKSLNIPFGFIALGGASDASFLEGHSYTYEGSTYGKIAEILIKTKCNNPIIFFDELDKVSMTKKGEEIIGILTHLTDITQNTNFNDKYFGEIEIDLSKCLFVFSYNDETLLNPILRDRITTIKVNGYRKCEKIIIARKYLLPNILKSFNIEHDTIIISNDIIEYIIEIIEEEEGVRNLKRGLESIISWINMYKFLPNNDIKIVYPFIITKQFVNNHLHKNNKNNIKSIMYI